MRSDVTPRLRLLLLFACSFGWLAGCGTASTAQVAPTATQTPPVLGKDRAQVVYAQHHGLVYSVAWSPDGARIASGGNDGMVHIWRPA